MRNLVCLGRTRTTIVTAQNGDAESTVPAIAPLPSSDNAFYVAKGPSPQTHEIAIFHVEGDEVQLLTSWPVNGAQEEIVDLRYLSTTASLCCILSGGDIVLIKTDAEEYDEKVEIIGNMEGGVLAAQWTLDEEILAIASDSKLLFMTSTFETIAEIPLSPADIAKHINQVSVGWGRAETQFRGLRAKNAPRDPTLPTKVEQGVVSPHDDQKVRLHWRGDGEFIALSRIEREEGGEGRRVVRVYGRDGAVESFSEAVDGMEGTLSWRPSGQWIATVKRSDEGLEVVFLERNGLRHGGFALRHGQGDVCELAWNSDSSCLAVLLRDRIQLWMVSNYNWKLKAEITRAGEGKSGFVWHPERPFILFAANGNVVERYEYVLDLVKDFSTPPSDFGLVAVVDGESLKLTPFRLQNIPPPMAGSQLTLSSTPTHVAFDSMGQYVAILRQRAVDIATWSSFSKLRIHSPKIIHAFSLNEFFDEADFVRQIVLLERNLIAILADDERSSLIKVLRHNEEGDEFEEAYCTRDLGRIIRLFPQANGTQLFCETVDGAVFDLSDLSDGQSPTPLGKFSTRCPWPAIASVDGHDVMFGLTTNGKLFASCKHLSPVPEMRLLASACTSFLLTPTHLLFTAQTLLKLIRLIPSIEDVEIPPDDLIDERVRQIERSSKLITIIPSTHTVILQHPRGNLETISPRALVLSSIRHAISNRDWRPAFLTCRTHRVDMNILWSHDEGAFLADVRGFVEQVREVEFIDLFLSALKELIWGTGRVSVVCDAVLRVLLEGYAESHSQCILTAHLSKIPPDIPAALSMIAQLKDENSELLKSAIEHICFLADVNQLYDEALGVYRIDIALLIAQKSQKDPREYLPFLRSLNEMDKSLSRFTIDDYLKRYTKALGHLSLCEPPKTFDDVLAYIRKHNLHQEGLRLYQSDQTHYDAILGLYAEYLAGNSRHDEAGFAYELVGQKQAAVTSYEKAGLWRECINVAYQIPLPAEEIRELALRLGDWLVEHRQFVDGARVYTDYGADKEAIEKAVEALAKGFMFTEAIRIVNDNLGPQYISTIVDPVIVESFGQMIELISEFKGQLNAQVPRLKLLREKKLEDPDAFFEGDGPGIDAPDDISVVATDITTSASLFTRYTAQTKDTRGTRASSKNRRREERKKARGKKGTVYEEEYLVNSLGRLVARVEDTRGDVEKLVRALMVCGMRIEARECQRGFAGLVEEIRGCVGEIAGDSETGRETVFNQILPFVGIEHV